MLSVPAVPGDAPAMSSQAAQYYLDGDDFYALPNNYNFGSNKRAFEFFNTYPEVQGRNYLMHFRKQGGSIPKLKSLC